MGYTNHWKIVDTASHGVAQTRCRSIGVSLRKDSIRRKIRWPSAVPLRHNMNSLLKPLNPETDTPYAWPGDSRLKPGSRGNPPSEKSRTRMRGLVRSAIAFLKQKSKKKRFVKDGSAVQVDVDCSPRYGRCSTNVCHTLTATRGSAGGPWCLHLGRRTKICELAHLQGVDWTELEVAMSKADDCSAFTDSFIGKPFSNATSCNVVERILPRALQCVGLLEREDWSDRWKRQSPEEVLPSWAIK